MNKLDYQLLARVLRENTPKPYQGNDDFWQHREMIADLAHVLERGHNHEIEGFFFNRVAFERACETLSEFYIP